MATEIQMKKGRIGWSALWVYGYVKRAESKPKMIKRQVGYLPLGVKNINKRFVKG